MGLDSLKQKATGVRETIIDVKREAWGWLDQIKVYQIGILILLLYRIYEFRYIPFGSPDDTFMAARSMSPDGNFDAAFDQAKSQGRFYQFL